MSKGFVLHTSRDPFGAVIGAVMEEASAELLLRECVEVFRALGRMDEVISRIQGDDERLAYARSLGGLIGDVTFDFVRPLTQEHPSLKALFE